MKFNIHKFSVVQLQWLVWACVLLMVFSATVAEDPFVQAVVFTILNTGFYAAIIYGNISFLYPRFYQKGKLVTYVSCSAIYIISLALMRGFAAVYIYNHYFSKLPVSLTPARILAVIAGATLDFVISLIFRIALAYFKLKQQSEEIRVQKSKAELMLLKSQVQPHFLFNTLNNIYYEAFTEAPKTAELIEKLSEIMRYFVDESPKEMVPLHAEVKFLENYIALERIRLRYGANISFKKQIDEDVMIPPMLLMTLVENIFKHGIDKTQQVNKVNINLLTDMRYLVLETVNRKVKNASVAHGFGLKNLYDRLYLLYGKAFELRCADDGNSYTAYLKIPI